MRAEWRGRHGEFADTVGVYFSTPPTLSDRKLDTIPAFQAAVVRTLNHIEADKPQFKVPEAGAYEKNGTIAVAVDGSMILRDQYHRVREATETWLRCKNLMLERCEEPVVA